MMIVAMLMTSLYNWTIEKVAYRPLRGSFRLAPLITAIGMSIALSNFVQVTQGPRNKPIPPMISKVYNIFGISISLKQIVIVVVTAVLLTLFWYLVNKTSLGRAQRACEQDRKMAALLGIDVDRTISITFIMGAALAAVAGTLYLMYYGVVVFSDGFVPGVKAFTAAVLGGIGSMPGRGARRAADRLHRGHVVGLFLDRLQGRRRLLDPGHRADLPAFRHSRPARSRKGLSTMAQPYPRTASKQRTPIQRAIREALYAGAISFGLFVLLIGAEDRPEHPQRADPRPALGPARHRRRRWSWPGAS